MTIEKKTKIIATIGPATNDVKTLVEMRKNGMNIVRLNFLHSNYNDAIPYIENIRKAEKETGRNIAIMQDLSGPKIRTGEFVDGEVTLKDNKIVEIFTKNILGTENEFSINYPKLLKDLKKNHRILLNDGKQELKVLSIGKNSFVLILL